MRRKIGIAAVTFALASVSAAPAFAQEFEGGYMRSPVRAPRGALELSVSTGFTQGFGMISGGRGNTIADTANAGIGVGAGIGIRATPYVSVGIAGQYQGLNPAQRLPTGTDVRGASAGIEATIHTMPYQRIDPWISVGGGYRMLWTMPEGRGNDMLTHGFELARVKVGMDMRLSQSVAISPVIGGDLNMFVWRNPEGPTGNREIADKRLNGFVFAGVEGRFDIGGARETELKSVAKR